jgi:hypothetical protein
LTDRVAKARRGNLATKLPPEVKELIAVLCQVGGNPHVLVLARRQPFPVADGGDQTGANP